MVSSTTQNTAVTVNLVDAALQYTCRGWSVIPVVGKKSLGRWKHAQERPPDEQTLRLMFRRAGVTGLAVVLGSASGGLACRDFDVADAYEIWAGAHPDLAAMLPTVKTVRGFHVYHGYDDEQYVSLKDGEYRADCRHYCLVPPSHHPDGPIYQWVVPLPDGKLPRIDPVESGLLHTHNPSKPNWINLPESLRSKRKQYTHTYTHTTHCMCPTL